MESKSPLRAKSYVYALHVTLFCDDLIEKQKKYVVGKQLLKSGTSVGANVEEAQHAESRKDFVSKLSIALKEAYESRFWLHIVGDARYYSQEEVEPLLQEVHEVISILASSIKTAKKNMKG